MAPCCHSRESGNLEKKDKCARGGDANVDFGRFAAALQGASTACALQGNPRPCPGT